MALPAVHAHAVRLAHRGKIAISRKGFRERECCRDHARRVVVSRTFVNHHPTVKMRRPDRHQDRLLPDLPGRLAATLRARQDHRTLGVGDARRRGVIGS
jgi:hypothetical protein